MILLSINSFNKSSRLYKWSVNGEYWSNYIKLDSDHNIQTYFTTNAENPATDTIEYLSNTIGTDELSSPVNNISIVESKRTSQIQHKLASSSVLTNRHNTYQKLFSIGNERFLALTVRDYINSVHEFTEIYRFDSNTGLWYVMQTLTIKSTNVQFLAMDNVQLLVCVDDNDLFVTYEFDDNNLIFNTVQSISNIRIPQGSSCSMQPTKHADGNWYIALGQTTASLQINIFVLSSTLKTFSLILTITAGVFPTSAILNEVNGKLLLLYSDNYGDYLGNDTEKHLVIKEIVGLSTPSPIINDHQTFQLTSLTGMSVFNDGQNSYLTGIKQYTVNVHNGIKFNHQLIQYKYDTQLNKFVQIPVLSNDFLGGSVENINFEIANLSNYIELTPSQPLELSPIPASDIIGDNCDNIVNYTVSNTGVTSVGFDTIHLSQKFGYFIVADDTNILTVYRLEYASSNENAFQYEYQYITLPNVNHSVKTVQLINNELYILALENTTYVLYYYEFSNTAGFEYKFETILNASRIDVYVMDNTTYIAHVQSGIELTISTIDLVNSQFNTIQSFQFPNGISGVYKYEDNNEHYLIALGYRIDPNNVATTKIYKWGTQQWLDDDNFESNYYTSASFFTINDNKFLCFTDGSSTGQNLNYKSIIFVKHSDDKFKPYQCLNNDLSNKVSYALIYGSPTLIFSTFFNKLSSVSMGDTEIFKWDGTYFVPDSNLNRKYSNNTDIKLIKNITDSPLLIDISETNVTFNSITTDLQRLNVIENPTTITSFDYGEIINNVDYTSFEVIPSIQTDKTFTEISGQIYAISDNYSDVLSTVHPLGINYNETQTINSRQFTYISVPYDPLYVHPTTTENNLIYSGIYPQLLVIKPSDDTSNSIFPIFNSSRISYSHNYKYNNVLMFDNVFKVNVDCNLSIHVTNLEVSQISHFIELYYNDEINPIKTNYVTFNTNIDSKQIVSKFNVFISAGSILRFAAYGDANIHIFSI